MENYSVLLILLNSILLFYICKSNKVHLLLKFFLCISYFGWQAFPSLLMYFPSIKINYQENYDIYLFCNYVSHISLFFSYLIFFYVIKKRRGVKFAQRKDFQDKQKFFQIMLYFAIVMGIYKIVFVTSSTLTYWESNDLKNMKVIDPFDYISALSIFYLLGVVLLNKDKISKLENAIILFILISYFLIQAFSGGRIYLFAIVFIFLYKALLKKNKFLNIGFAGLLGYFALLLLPALSQLRGSDDVNLNETLQLSSSTTTEQIIDEIIIKTNSIYTSSYLLSSDGIGNQGVQIYTSSLYALFPRFIFPSKPELGSVDGTRYGIPARRAAMYITGDDYNEISNVGTNSFIVALWSQGYVALVFQVLTTILVMLLINAIFYSKKAVWITFALSLISFPICQLDVRIYDFVANAQRYIVIYFLLYILFNLRKKNS